MASSLSTSGSATTDTYKYALQVLFRFKFDVHRDFFKNIKTVIGEHPKYVRYIIRDHAGSITVTCEVGSFAYKITRSDDPSGEKIAYEYFNNMYDDKPYGLSSAVQDAYKRCMEVVLQTAAEMRSAAISRLPGAM